MAKRQKKKKERIQHELLLTAHAGRNKCSWLQYPFYWESFQTFKLCNMDKLTKVSHQVTKICFLLIILKCFCHKKFFFFFFFFWLHPWHAEVPRPGIKPLPQQQQCQIFNPLSHKGTPETFFFLNHCYSLHLTKI